MDEIITINEKLIAFAKKYNEPYEFNIWIDILNKGKFTIYLENKSNNQNKIILNNLDKVKAINIAKSILESR